MATFRSWNSIKKAHHVDFVASLIKVIQCLKNKHNDILWVKLDQGFFYLETNIFLAVVYFSPANYNNNIPDMESVYSHLLDDIEN